MLLQKNTRLYLYRQFYIRFILTETMVMSKVVELEVGCICVGESNLERLEFEIKPSFIRDEDLE